MMDLIRLMRPKHWLKNGLLLFPLFFSGQLFRTSLLLSEFIGIVSFCLASSAIYIINDIYDAESDRKHEKKKYRPIAAGRVQEKTAKFAFVVAVSLALLVNTLIASPLSFATITLIAYILLNVGYTIGLKKVPIIDIAILVSGFLIRIYYGAAIVDIEVSNWLFLAVMSFALYLGLGKRRNELTHIGKGAEEVRGVLKYYTPNFLDKHMYFSLTLGITCYALWAASPPGILHAGTKTLTWTIPMVILICMRYNLVIESGSSADPVEVFTNDKWLIVMVIIYVLAISVFLYSRGNLAGQVTF